MVGKLCAFRGWGSWCVLFLTLGAGSWTRAEEPDNEPFPLHGFLITIVTDKDDTFDHNVQSYDLYLAEAPGSETHLFPFNTEGMKKVVKVPVYEYEGLHGLKIEDLVGKYVNGRFRTGPMIDEVTLPNGEKFRPGYYFFHPVFSMREFRPHPSGSPKGFYYQGVADRLKTKTPFLLESSIFVRDALNPAHGSRITAIELTLQGLDDTENQETFELLKKKIWPEIDPKRLHYVGLSDLEKNGIYEMQKKLFIEDLWQQQNQRATEPKQPHYLIFFENGQKHLFPLEKALMRIADEGTFQHRVIPILVNLEEETSFLLPNGLDITRSSLYRAKEKSRIQIFKGNGEIEKSDHLPKLFEIIHGMNSKQAIAYYNKLRSKQYMCRDLANGSRFLPTEKNPLEARNKK